MTSLDRVTDTGSAPDRSARVDWREWAPEGVIAGSVALVGLVQVRSGGVGLGAGVQLLIVVAMSLAVLTSRHHAAVSLALVWLVGLLELVAILLLGLTPSVTLAAVVVVAFGTARWGSTPTMWLSGLSIPAVTGIALLLALIVRLRGDRALFDLLGGSAFAGVRSFSGAWLGAVLLGLFLLGAPWLLGLALRFRATAQTSRADQDVAEHERALAVSASEQAHEIARLREEQARMARDVHDVVGHSLAVILAQAESAQYLEDSDAHTLKRTMTQIATSARASLQDVRHVLTPGAAPARGGLDRLIDGVGASGHEVVSSEEGVPQPLPPELETVAYRVLQEMLTNAIKHGRRGEPVFVERHWPDGDWSGELRIEVRNTRAPDTGPVPDDTAPLVVAEHRSSADAPGDEAGSGQGLSGMRRRLEGVGGRLDVRRRETPEGPTFTATAWIPVRAAR